GDVGRLKEAEEGLLKEYTGGSAMTFNRKFMQPITARPTARLVFAMNEPPKFQDRTDGLWRRLIMLPFDKTIPPGARKLGMDNPSHWAEEAAGIFNWSLEGLDRLRDQKRFTEPKACKDAAEEHHLKSDPALAFVLDNLTADPKAPPLMRSSLYDAFRQYLDGRGIAKPIHQHQPNAPIAPHFPD